MENKPQLSPRELQVVSALVAGYTNKQIAKQLKISETTVKHHLSNIFDKLGVSSRLELALLAAQWFGSPEDADTARACLDAYTTQK